MAEPLAPHNATDMNRIHLPDAAHRPALHRASLAAALALMPAGAQAAENAFEISGTAAVVTDYVFRGVSYSNGHAAVQGSLTWSKAGGIDGLHYVQQQAKEITQQTQFLSIERMRALQHLDQLLIARNLSPGGSADLLAITWLLHQLDR